MKNQWCFLVLVCSILLFSLPMHAQKIGTSSSSYYEFVPENVTFIGVWRALPNAKKQIILPPGNDFGKLKRIASSKGYSIIGDLDIGFHNNHYSVWEKPSNKGRRKNTRTSSRSNPRQEDVKEYTWQSLQKRFKYRATNHIKNIQITAKNEYTLTFGEGSVKQQVIRANSWNQFVSKWKKVRATNMRLRCIAYSRGEFIGLFDAAKRGTYLYNLIGWKAFTKKWEELGKKNYRLVDIETYKVNGKMHYIGIWHYGKEGYFLWNVKGYYNFQKKFDELKKQGLQLVDIEVIMPKWN